MEREQLKEQAFSKKKKKKKTKKKKKKIRKKKTLVVFALTRCNGKCVVSS